MDIREINPDILSADELAQACARIMWSQDLVPKSLGMNLGPVTSGRAELSMPVRHDMINGHDICHGGFIFTLADAAFAYACNGYNQFTVAQHCTISFVKSARVGQILTAAASEKIREGRSGIYDVTVTNEENVLIAEFRGLSRTLKGSFLPE